LSRVNAVRRPGACNDGRFAAEHPGAAAVSLPFAFLFVFGFLGAATIWWGRGRIRRLELERMPVLIGEAMMRLGITPADAEAAGLDRAVAAAGERCRDCPAGSECRDWLAYRTRPAPGRRCRNAVLLDEIKARRPPQPPPASPPRNLGIY
jgi:hypothetical protein